MLNIDKKAQEFWHNGYLSIDDFFDAQLMDKYQQRILMHFGDEPGFLSQQRISSKNQTPMSYLGFRS